MRLSRRLSKLRTRLTASFPPACPPLVVLAATASADHPPGRWVRADGATVGVRLADGQPFPALPGDPVVIGGDIDAADLLADTATFVPDAPPRPRRTACRG